MDGSSDMAANAEHLIVLAQTDGVKRKKKGTGSVDSEKNSKTEEEMNDGELGTKAGAAAADAVEEVRRSDATLFRGKWAALSEQPSLLAA
jgi:acetylglutamate kinase